MAEFKDRIHALRKSQNLSQGELAAKLGESKTYVMIALYEKGSRMPKIATLMKLADIFDVSVDYLLGRTDNPHGIITHDKVNGHDVAIEGDSREYPNGMTHEQVLKTLDKLIKLGIKVDID